MTSCADIQHSCMPLALHLSWTTAGQHQVHKRLVRPSVEGSVFAGEAQRQQKVGARSQRRSPLNEVVAGAMMLAYERAGQVDKVIISPLTA